VKPRRVVEDVLVPAQIVAPQPVTVSQRNCLECFGLSKGDYLRLAGRAAFPVKVVGKLRIARFADVEAYLTSGAASRSNAGPKPAAPAPRKRYDVDALLHDAGFRPRKA